MSIPNYTANAMSQPTSAAPRRKASSRSKESARSQAAAHSKGNGVAELQNGTTTRWRRRHGPVMLVLALLIAFLVNTYIILAQLALEGNDHVGVFNLNSHSTSPNLNNNPTAQNLQNDSTARNLHNNSTELSWEQNWSKLKQLLCPAMKPNVKFSIEKALFDHGRDQLGLPKTETRGFIQQFFHHSTGAVWFRSLADKGDNVIYLRLWKCGNDQIRENLLDRGRNGQGVEAWDIPKVDRKLRDLSRYNREACLVTAVRDPVERFLSGYNEMEWRASLPEFDRVRYSWKSPPATFVKYEDGTDVRFEQFVKDFVGGFRGTNPAVPKSNMGHVFSMTGALTKLGSKKLTAYLPTLRNLHVDFPKMVSRECPGLPAEMGDPFTVETDHGSQHHEMGFLSSAKRVWNAGNATSRALCSIHAMDYACYDKVPVPSICQQVFMDDTFLDEVIRANSITVAEPALNAHLSVHKMSRANKDKILDGKQEVRKKLISDTGAAHKHKVTGPVTGPAPGPAPEQGRVRYKLGGS